MQNLKFILVGVVIVGGITVAYADGWLNPTAAAPTANIPAPIHTGPTQVKDGGLAVGTFAVQQNALFAQNTYVNGAIYGGQPGDVGSTVKIGGIDTGGNTHTIPVTVTGDVNVKGTIVGSTVANANNSNLCANKDGTITLCNINNTAAGHSVALSVQSSGGTSVALALSGPVVDPVTANISMKTTNTTAIAGCNAPTTYTSVGSLTIPAYATTSTSSIAYPANCPVADIQYTITSYSPTTSGGTAITANQ